MSHKKLKLSEDKYIIKRDSFSDRFCDDLCEVIVSYLSFEDKIRLECVSHQFQRLIYNKQYVIEMQTLMTGNTKYFVFCNKNFLNKLLQKRVSIPNDNEINLIAFESVLKKCQFINNIAIDFNNTYVLNREKVLQLITKYCNNLRTISFDFQNISQQTLRLFGLKFGQSLRTIGFEIFADKYIYKTILSLCPNLEAINAVKVNDLIQNELTLNKLKKVMIYSESINSFKTFVDYYRNSLKSLEMGFGNSITLDSMEEISRLTNLEELRLDISFDTNDGNSLLTNKLHKIALNCTQIKHLVLDYENISSLLVKKVFQTIGHFNQIKVLDLYLDISDEDLQDLSIKCLKGCKQLTHFKFDNPNQSEDFIKDIDIYLPQLTHFHIRTNEDLTNDTMYSLSKLNKLKAITFEGLFGINKFSNITDSGLCAVVYKCPQLKSIRFNRGPNITFQTIDALIGLSLRKPRIYFNHFFGSIGEDIAFYRPVLNINDYQSLPNNMNIIISGEDKTDSHFYYFSYL